MTDPIRLRKALEIANPDLEITEEIIMPVKAWCDSQIELVEGILNGQYAPTWNSGELKIYKYPSDLAKANKVLLDAQVN
jgi:hypothetical protein